MIINFYNLGGGGSGSGGTSNYNELENKPQINGVTLSGNKTSQDLGIASESLEAVNTVPSGASVGDVYAVNKSQTVGYGWEQIENGYAFNCSLNPISGEGATYVYLGGFLGPNYDTAINMHSSNSVEVLGEYTKIGFTRRIEVSGGYINVNYYNYHRIEFTFEGIDVPTLQNAIASASTTIVENKTVQVETVNAPLAHWEFWNQYQGRYQEIQFWLEQNGQKDFLPSTELGLFHYYELYYKLYTNADGLFCIDYSNDSGTTWSQYIHNANMPMSEPEYYPVDITDPNGKNALFKAWFKAGNGNYGVTIKSNKFLWIDNYVTPTGVITKNLIKEGDSYESLTELPQINGVTLIGNKYSDELGINNYDNLLNKPSINGVELFGNVTSDDLNLSVDKVKELEAITVLPTVARDGSVFAYSQPETVFGWENIGYDADNKFRAEFVFKQMPNVSDMPITLGTANVTGSLDETISQDLVLLNDFFDGIMIQVGTENYMRKGQSSEFWYHGDNNLKCEYDWTNEALLKFAIYESNTSQTKSGATITNQVNSTYVSINSLVQADGVNASGETIYKKVGADGMNIHWYTYADGCFMYARENCTNDGDYLVHQGPEISGSRTVSGVRISGGTIVEAPYGGLTNIGDGHWAGSKEDTNGVSYFFHCWVEDGYLYWQTSSPIMMLDAYGTGTDLQGGLMYGGEQTAETPVKPVRFTNLDLSAMSVGDTIQVVVAMPDMEFGKQYLRASSGATSGVSFGASIDDFANVVTIPSYVFTLTKEDTIPSLGWERFSLTPSDTVNFTKLSWYCSDSNTAYPLSLVSNFNNNTLAFYMGKVKLLGSWVDPYDHSTSWSRQFASYIESQQQLKYNPYRDGDIEFIIYKVPTA